jgi:peptide/nickel transport system substrate-binding protein
VGAGPYKLEQWVKGSHITLARFDDYYGPRPYFDKIIFKFVGDASTRMLMMETGEADVGLRMLPADIPRLEKNPKLAVDRIMGRNIFFMLHCKKPPFDKKEVRQAANYAVDKKAIIDRILSGAGTPAHSLVEAVQGTINAGFYDYRPEKAKAMIKAAGAEGAKVLLISPTTRYLMDSEVAQAVAGYLRTAGLDVSVRAFGDWPSFVSAVRNGEFNMHMIGWGGSTGDPDNAYRLTIFGDRAGKPWNVGAYANPEVDALIIAGSKEIDQAKRAEIYAKVQRMVWDDAPWLFLHRLNIFMVRDHAIKGIISQPGIEMPYFWLSHRE